MSSESRVIRPFDAQSLEHVFHAARLRCGSMECEPGKSLRWDDPTPFSAADPKLMLAPESEFDDFRRLLGTGAAEAGVDVSLLSLLVTASTSYLKITDTVGRSLADLSVLPRVIGLAGMRASQASTSGTVVRAYVVLSKTLPRRALKPWRKGTWLARAEFKIKTGDESSPYALVRLDDEKRKELGLRRQTMRYVDLADHNSVQPFDEGERPEFYVDANFLDELDAQANSPVGRALQAQLVVDFVTAVILDAHKRIRPEDRYADLEDSLAGRVVRRIASRSASGDERDKLVRWIREKPAKVIACAEDPIGLLKTQLDSLRGEAR